LQQVGPLPSTASTRIQTEFGTHGQNGISPPTSLPTRLQMSIPLWTHILEQLEEGEGYMVNRNYGIT
jgi:hypothetical protein